MQAVAPSHQGHQTWHEPSINRMESDLSNCSSPSWDFAKAEGNHCCWRSTSTAAPPSCSSLPSLPSLQPGKKSSHEVLSSNSLPAHSATLAPAKVCTSDSLPSLPLAPLPLPSETVGNSAVNVGSAGTSSRTNSNSSSTTAKSASDSISNSKKLLKVPGAFWEGPRSPISPKREVFNIQAEAGSDSPNSDGSFTPPPLTSSAIQCLLAKDPRSGDEEDLWERRLDLVMRDNGRSLRQAAFLTEAGLQNLRMQQARTLSEDNLIQQQQDYEEEMWADRLKLFLNSQSSTVCGSLVAPSGPSALGSYTGSRVGSSVAGGVRAGSDAVGFSSAPRNAYETCLEETESTPIASPIDTTALSHQITTSNAKAARPGYATVYWLAVLVLAWSLSFFLRG